jgi:MYND finger
MPPSSSSKKEKKGRKSQKRKPKPIDEEEEKKLVEVFKASPWLGGSLGVVSEEVEALADKTPPPPDNPPCDGCLQPFTGTMLCSRCESVFYCCRECQESHWTSKHKAECAELKRQSKQTARQVLQSFEKMRGWGDLDVAGAYKAAVDRGLHDKIRSVLELDMGLPDCMIERYREGCASFCYTHCVMTTLFRGQRAEGKVHALSNSFNCVDSRRIKGYVRSHPYALDTWLQASVQLLRVVNDQAFLRKPEDHLAVCAKAMDVWRVWSLVFYSSRASRAILTPFPSIGSSCGDEGVTEEQKGRLSEDHARRIVLTLRDAIRLMLNVSRHLDALQFTVIEVASRVHVRIQEHRIGVDVASILDLSDNYKFMYEQLAFPTAERELYTGRALTARETNGSMARTLHMMGRLDI